MPSPIVLNMSQLELNGVNRRAQKGFSLVKQLTFSLEAEEDHAGFPADFVVPDLQLFHQPFCGREDDFGLILVVAGVHPPRPGRVNVVVVAKLFPLVKRRVRPNFVDLEGEDASPRP